MRAHSSQQHSVFTLRGNSAEVTVRHRLSTLHAPCTVSGTVSSTSRVGNSASPHPASACRHHTACRHHSAPFRDFCSHRGGGTHRHHTRRPALNMTALLSSVPFRVSVPCLRSVSPFRSPAPLSANSGSPGLRLSRSAQRTRRQSKSPTGSHRTPSVASLTHTHARTQPRAASAPFRALSSELSPLPTSLVLPSSWHPFPPPRCSAASSGCRAVSRAVIPCRPSPSVSPGDAHTRRNKSLPSRPSPLGCTRPHTHTTTTAAAQIGSSHIGLPHRAPKGR